MKTVDFKDGKFEVKDSGDVSHWETTEGDFDKDGTEYLPCENEKNILVETGEDFQDVIDREKKEEIDCSEATVKSLNLPEGLKTCVGVDGTFHIKVEVKGWVSLDRQQAAKLAYTLAKFVES